MSRTRWLGLGLTALGTVGYAIGVAAPYPGRSASIVGIMVGVTLYAVGYESGGGAE
jgi:hypothetical protein